MDKKIILKSNISDAVNHREAARIAAKRAEDKGNTEEAKNFVKEQTYWQDKINGFREELQSL
jgi:hypothetical protein